MQSVMKVLDDRPTLLVMDNCEQVVEPVADLVAAVLEGAAATHLLVTSREPLRVAGECVHRLAPLDMPRDLAALSAGEALNSPALQLFA